MKRLIVDTSSEQCIVALADQESVLSHALFEHENRLSQTLLPTIRTLLDTQGVSLKEIDSIAVGVGPGSYTGTRVGVAVAKSLAFGLNISLRGFCSLVAFIPEHLGHFAGILRAKSGLFYLLKGKRGSESICIEHTGLIAPDKLVEVMHTVDFITARTNEDLPLLELPKPFIPFQTHIENIVLSLQSPPQFVFESQVQLIYLNAESNSI